MAKTFLRRSLVLFACGTMQSRFREIKHDVRERLHEGRSNQYFAVTVAWTGEKELALQQLETGLRAPTASFMLSYGALKLLPFWDPLRGDPRFEKIIASLAPKDTK
jgi:hypothetical protein